MTCRHPLRLLNRGVCPCGVDVQAETDRMADLLAKRWYGSPLRRFLRAEKAKANAQTYPEVCAAWSDSKGPQHTVRWYGSIDPGSLMGSKP